MQKKDKSLAESSLDIILPVLDLYKNHFVYHNRRYINECAEFCKEFSKNAGIPKDEYELGIVALNFSHIANIDLIAESLRVSSLMKKYFDSVKVSDKQKSTIKQYLNFIINGDAPHSQMEMVLWDCRDIALGLPDALERLNLMRIEQEKIHNKIYKDLEWELYCKQYFVSHTFFTTYAIKTFGNAKSKNYLEVEKRIDKLHAEDAKDTRDKMKDQEELILSSKEREDLFKIAFRNYLNLVGLADRKAHLLIQINCILSSVIIGFTIKRGDYNTILVVPGAAIILSAGLTIFYCILASKPLDRFFDFDNIKNEAFFFGSFDRIDPNFQGVTWDKYSKDINELFTGNKVNIFNQLIQESYLVRKVLSKKFGYISIAYKIFIWGLSIALLMFFILIMVKAKF